MKETSLTRIIPRQDGTAEEIAKGLSYSEGHNRPDLSLVNVEHGNQNGRLKDMAVKYAMWLKDIRIMIPGCLDHTDDEIQADGVACFAAQFIAKFKDEAGQMYLRRINNHIPYAVEYIYTLYPLEGEDTVMSIYKVSTDTVIFIGKPEEILKGEKDVNGQNSLLTIQQDIEDASARIKYIRKDILERESAIATGGMKKEAINFNQNRIDTFKQELKQLEEDLQQYDRIICCIK